MDRKLIAVAVDPSSAQGCIEDIGIFVPGIVRFEVLGGSASLPRKNVKMHSRTLTIPIIRVARSRGICRFPVSAFVTILGETEVEAVITVGGLNVKCQAASNEVLERNTGGICFVACRVRVIEHSGLAQVDGGIGVGVVPAHKEP